MCINININLCQSILPRAVGDGSVTNARASTSTMPKLYPGQDQAGNPRGGEIGGFLGGARWSFSKLQVQ